MNQRAASSLGAGYRIADLSKAVDLSALGERYAALPIDPYVPQGFRRKQLVRCRVHGSRIVEQPHGPLYQPCGINPTQGGIVRHYDRFPWLSLVAPAVLQFARACGFDETHEVLVQPHRITCSPGAAGEPAVEGYHRDGIHFLGIMCIDRAGIVGGETHLSRDRGRTIALRRTLAPGEMLVIDDREWFHYTTPIEVEECAPQGHRDVLLLSSHPYQVNRAPELKAA